MRNKLIYQEQVDASTTEEGIIPRIKRTLFQTGGVKQPPIKVRHRDIEAMLPTDNIEEIVPRVVGVVSVKDKPSLIEMLKRSGSLVTSASTHKELLDSTFKALKDSDRFRRDFSAYLKGQATDSNFGNFVGDDKFSNYTKYDPKTGTGGSSVGNLLRNVLTQENISALAGAGIAAYSTKLQNKAASKGNQQAIDYERAKADTAAAEALKLQAQGNVPLTKSTKPKWVMPVVIGGSLLVVGAIIYFVVKKKK